MFLDYLALGVLLCVILIMFYGVIVIHDIPYDIAKKRNHPHQDAIHVAGWISLLTLHIIWPFLWIWATLYREDKGWGMNADSTNSTDSAEAVESAEQQITELTQRIAALEAKLEDN